MGELLANQCRVGLARTERLVKERMTLFDQELDTMTPAKLINPKALSAVVRDFFGRSQLSQFMDQINPLAELTHKRRLSALGPAVCPGNVPGSRCATYPPTTVGFVRWNTGRPKHWFDRQLGHIRPVNDFGFIESPYRRCPRAV